ncbi:MAG TPA: hypothetical protein VFL51_01650 [Pseudolabrys sp.]|nr:hypothetical protein [Pseudolabrys sp.]
MRYRNSAEPAPAAKEAWEETGCSAGRIGSNINAVTGLSTDYLNHFNEAIMLLEMFASFPGCLADILAWRPMSYRQHFAASQFKDRAVAIAAYDAADASLRGALDMLAGTMNAVLETARAAMSANLPPEEATTLATRTAAALKPLVARAGAVINGEQFSGQVGMPQAAVDMLFDR